MAIERRDKPTQLSKECAADTSLVLVQGIKRIILHIRGGEVFESL